MIEIQNFVNGKFVPSMSGKSLPKVCPGTGEVYANLPDSTAPDVDAAVRAASDAFPSWAATPVQVRHKILNRLADLLEQRLEEFAKAESLDQGKSVTTALTIDIPRSVSNLRYYAGFILHTEEMSSVLDSPVRAVTYSVRKPHGVVGLISPWNLPLYLATWKIAPAVAFGNTCVLKPSELSPLTMFMFCSLLNDAGVPSGVVNVVHGLGERAGQALVEHPKVLAISFTGGTVTGKRIATTCAPLLKKLSLELGGKNANIVFSDCDLEDCVATSVRSSFANQGEICLCGSRILVQDTIFKAFLDKFVAATEQVKVGDPANPANFMGALVSGGHLEKVMGYVKLAQQEGGVVVTGGKRPANLPPSCRKGYFLEPTIITNLGPRARCNQEEIFGPVVTVMPFKDEAEAIAIANGTPYGLSASVHTRDVAKALRVANALEVGYAWVNCWLVRDLKAPFGGMKQSGLGREGGKFSLEFYTEVKSICSKY